ncbi:MAG: hypothetical protein GY858_03290 [Candidatus Omnitrophica bacterium]|nr:hypothetical protein [Candidatus Omnitrophota bacterium]
MPSGEEKETYRVHINIKFEPGRTGRAVDIVVLEDNQKGTPHKVRFRKEDEKISWIEPKEPSFFAGFEIKRLDTEKYFRDSEFYATNKKGLPKGLPKDITKLGDCKPLHRYMVIADFCKKRLEEYAGEKREKWQELTQKAEDKKVKLFYVGQEEYGFLKNGQQALNLLVENTG